MAKKLSKKQVKRLISDLVHRIELADLAEIEDSELDLRDFHRGTATGLRAALEIISKKAVPEYALIKRGQAYPYRFGFISYEETGAATTLQEQEESELALDWCD
jgi:hypothetical protein